MLTTATEIERPAAKRVVEGGPHWFAYVAENGRNELADRSLRQLGYMTFCPFERERVRTRIPCTQRYRVHWRERPYFGRYQFVALRYEHESLYEIDDADGVQTVWRPGKRPMWIQSEVMDAIMTLSDHRGEMPVTSRTQKFKPGSRFTIAVGHAFAGFVAEMSDLSKIDSHGTIRAWVDNILGGRRDVELPAWAVGEPA